MKVIVDAAYVFRAMNGFRMQSGEGELEFADYNKLFAELSALAEEGDEISYHVYVTEYAWKRAGKFLYALKQLGAVTKSKMVRGTRSRDRDVRDNWDVGIAVDLTVMATMGGERDFVIVAGSAALSPALEWLRTLTARVTMAGFEGSIAGTLLAVPGVEVCVLDPERLKL